MPSSPVPNPPPGFDELSPEEQIEYLQRLWNHIAADDSKIDVPQWHRDILRQRISEDTSEEASSWDEVKKRLERRGGR